MIEVPHCQVLNSKCMDIYTSLSLKLKNKDVSSDFKRKESIEFDDEQSLEEVLSLKKRSFKQNHSVMNEVLKKSIKNRIEKNIEEKSEEKTEEQSSPIKGVLELFCGNGNFSELFISEGQHFFGFENCKNSIDKFKFRFKKFPLARVKLKDLFRSKILRSEIPFPVDTLFLDPPRSGFSKLGSLLKEFPEIQQVIYVSCNLSTMERDLYQIVDKGFKAQLLEAYDFFPQTPHFETLVWLSR